MTLPFHSMAKRTIGLLSVGSEVILEYLYLERELEVISCVCVLAF